MKEGKDFQQPWFEWKPMPANNQPPLSFHNLSKALMSRADPGPAKVCPLLKLVFFPLRVSALESAEFQPDREEKEPFLLQRRCFLLK